MEDPIFKSIPNLEIGDDFSIDLFNNFSLDKELKKWMEELEKTYGIFFAWMDSARVKKKKDKTRIYKM